MMQPSTESFINDRIDSIRILPAPRLPEVADWKKQSTRFLVGRLDDTAKVDKPLAEYNLQSKIFNEDAQNWNVTGSRRYLEHLAAETDPTRLRLGEYLSRQNLNAQFDKVRDAYGTLRNAVSQIRKPEAVWLQTFKREVCDEFAKQLENTAGSMQEGMRAMVLAEQESRPRVPGFDQAPPSGVLGLEAAGQQDGRVYSFSIAGDDIRPGSVASAHTPLGSDGDRFSLESLEGFYSKTAAKSSPQRSDQGQPVSSRFSTDSGDSRTSDRTHTFSIDNDDTRLAGLAPEAAPQRRPDQRQSEVAVPAEPRTRSGEHRTAARTTQDTTQSTVKNGKQTLGRGSG